MFISFAIMKKKQKQKQKPKKKKKTNQLMPRYIVQIQPIVPDP